MPNNNELVLVDEKYLENKIYIIRGQKVMLDSDLAKIYGYTTKRFNEQIKNNLNKFAGEDFMFRLSRDEALNLVRSKFSTSPNISMFKGQNGGSRYLPYVFTESGIYMLMTVLKGDLATKQSRTLIRLFKSMKDYLLENKDLLPNNELELRTKLLENDVKDINNHLDNVDNSLNKVMGYFEDKDSYKHFLILDGQKLEADIAYRNIIKQAKSSIICIDNYISLKSLELLSYAGKNVSITIFSNNKANPSLKESMIDDFNTQNKTNKLSLYKPSLNIHDRYIIIDYKCKNETIYHSGSSLKDTGNKISTITKLEMTKLYKPVIEELLKGAAK